MFQPPQFSQQHQLADATPMGPPLDPIAALRTALRGHYDIERELGQGAFATVYLARDLKHERKVAIKVLHADPTSETGELRFIREIRLLARLQHPNILPLHDSGHVETLLYYVMPYVSGDTLRDRIDRERQLPIEMACNTARDIADALAYAHGQGIIHRDIKPENILLSAGHPVLADFGIARVIDVAGVRQLTRTGMGSPGTPAYMSPEQLMGDKELDGRSDTYSLACVLFEMLTGRPPFSGKDGFVKRFTEAPPAPSRVRREVPGWIDEMLSVGLARDPADRYPTAGEFVRALTHGLSHETSAPTYVPAGISSAAAVSTIDPAASGGMADRSPPADHTGNDGSAVATGPIESRETFWRRLEGRLPSGPTRRAIYALTGVGVLAAVGIANSGPLKRSLGFAGSPDSTQYAIVPFTGDSRASGTLAANASDKLYDAFSALNGLRLVPDLKVDEAIKDAGHSPRTLSEAIAVARRLNAGQLVWGHVVRVGNSLRPRAELYDLRQPNVTAKEVLLETGDDQPYAQAALTLLAPTNRPTAAVGGDGQTRNYPAWIAYNRGHIALARWDLAGAEREFSYAVAADPAFPAARLWLGQLREWKSPLSSELWRDQAERAAAASGAMKARDSLLATALASMAANEYPQACTAYRQLTRLDSADFIGWYGLGECQGLDRVVLPDPSSPSHWRWRSSYDAAVKAFVRALRTDPGAYGLLSFERLRRLLPTTAVNPRTDTPIAPNFAAFPSLADADTLAFVPYPIAVFRSGLPPGATKTLNRALSRNLDLLMGIVKNWIDAAPESSEAWESRADLLETHGDIAEGSDPSVSASAAVRRAYSLSRDPQQRLRLAVREARLRFKRGDYVGTRIAADSILRSRPQPDSNSPPVLISLTALTGRVQATAEQAALVEVPQKLDGMTLPSALRMVAGDLFANAALGVCGDTLTALRGRLEEQLRNTIADDQRDNVRSALITRASSMMVPCTGGASALTLPSDRGNLLVLQKSFAQRDRAAVDRRFQAIAKVRRVYRPGDLSFDRSYQEAWIRTAIGDTLGAIRELDESLGAIPAMSAAALREVGAASAAGRAMALRAELAAARGDTAVARRWASAVSELWQEADQSLQPVVSRMRAIAAGAR